MEREEGELSDEEYEDVSDNSSISALIISGKSSPLSTAREPFQELSLTSVSDVSEENDYVSPHRRKRKLIPSTHLRTFSKRSAYNRASEFYNHDRNYVRKKRKEYDPHTLIRNESEYIHREYSNVSSSTESDYYIPDRKILRQLRDAVRVNTQKKSPNCSLRTRIKRMIQPELDELKDSSSDDDHELEALRDQALQSKAKSENQSDPPDSPTITDDDLIKLRLVALHSAVLKKHQNRRKRKEEEQKSQQTPAENGKEGVRTEKDTETVPETLPENHSEVLPAKSNTSEQVVVKEDADDEDEDILRAMVLTSICNKIADKKNSKEEEEQPKENKVAPNPVNTPESKPPRPSSIHVNRFVINVDSDSDSDEQMDSDKPSKISNTDMFDKSLSLFLKQARAKSEINNSDISKHLPRTQQLEYKRLKRKLQQLTGRIQSASKVKNTLNENKRAKLVNTSVKNIAPRTTLPATNLHFPCTVARSPNKTLVKTANNVSDKQFNRVSRLQMKGKYEELHTLMTRVSEARKLRDNAQAEVKCVMNDLLVSRAKLTSAHQNYTALVQELVKAKANIDKRFNDEERMIKAKDTNVCTSTPNKPKQKEITCEISRIDENVTEEQELNLTDAAAAASLKPIENEKDENTESKLEPIEDLEELPYVPAPNKDKDKLKYNSPLDHIQLNRGEPSSDPLLVLCPYDLLGVCRDADCSYRHCGMPVSN